MAEPAAPPATTLTEDAIIHPHPAACAELPAAAAVEPEEPDELRIARALKLKEEGNTCYAVGEIEKAVELYSAAIHRVVFYSNRAMCYIKKANFDLAVKDCTSALEIAPNHGKSLQRRAIANENLKKYKESQDDWEAVLKLEPNNKEAKTAVATLPEKSRLYEEEQKAEAMGTSLWRRFANTPTVKLKEVVQDPKSGGYSISIQK